MCLLYKEGDPTLMKNYHSLSLANMDYELFTRIINSRVMQFSIKLINRHQLGFIPDRFIAGDDMICQVIMEDAQRKWIIVEQHGNVPHLHTLDADIGLLLDQEKAYDHVNLVYLQKVLLNLAFPENLSNVSTS